MEEDRTSMEPGKPTSIEGFSPVNAYGRIGVWGWLGLYMSGALLLFFLIAHVWVVHFGTAEPLSFKTTLQSLASPFTKTVESGLLVLVVVHGLIGFRRIILDLEIMGKKGVRYFTWGLTIVGIALSVWGFILLNTLRSAPGWK